MLSNKAQEREKKWWRLEKEKCSVNVAEFPTYVARYLFSSISGQNYAYMYLLRTVGARARSITWKAPTTHHFRVFYGILRDFQSSNVPCSLPRGNRAIRTRLYQCSIHHGSFMPCEYPVWLNAMTHAVYPQRSLWSAIHISDFPKRIRPSTFSSIKRGWPRLLLKYLYWRRREKGALIIIVDLHKRCEKALWDLTPKVAKHCKISWNSWKGRTYGKTSETTDALAVMRASNFPACVYSSPESICLWRES